MSKLIGNNQVVGTNNIVIIAVVVALVQFINALEYMMVTPLFVYMSKDFHMPVTMAGVIAGAYVFSSVFSGLTSFFFIDRFNKRKVLILNTLFLGLITFLTIFSSEPYQLILLRIIAGLFGGVTLGVGIGILLNNSPESMRGRVLGIAFSSFSFVSILGIPLCLYLAESFNWKVSFLFIVILCIVSLPLILFFIPGTEKVKNNQNKIVLTKKITLAGMASGVSNFSPFMLIPILAPLLTNVFYIPENQVSLVFFCGGIASWLGTYLTGKLCDRYPPQRITIAAATLFIVNIFLGLTGKINGYVFFSLFMFATYVQVMAANVLASYASTPENRAGFGALQMAFSNLGAGVVFFFSSIFLDGKEIIAENVRPIFILTMVSALVLPIYVIKLARMMKRGTKNLVDNVYHSN
ncbi:MULTISPECIES: MFS transporter [Photorhabdus]|uniref:MFS transporter n=2 Tax=Photorhabdus TaxID=29487 RepID=A0ABX0B7I9_9GAMM|nr:MULTISPECIES: MFS transporter [Photorhabdus]MCC8376652.1 MFS transporter [Photorhabdus bodei]MCC8466935.1 MFS transporter [Photorhabdus bodei]MCT8354166.1 MFS transporter [Photorhabdus kayaii]MDB6373824.1 MFS transporter [Photorhabdus bodei]NDL13349.1 MFS transporter [Photorhabdus kayaii]